MKKISKFLMPLLVLILFQGALTAFDDSTVDEYSLNFLRADSAPRMLKLVRNRNTLRNVTVENGTLFTYKARKAKSASIAGNFSSWAEIPMNKGENGVWFYFLPQPDGISEINYKFVIDGIWIYDPNNSEKKDDMAGSFVSVAYPPVNEFDRHVTYRILEKREKYSVIEFRVYEKNAFYVSLAGDFNRWNPENDVLKKGHGGIWTITKKIPYGLYRYKYMVDGKWEVDLYNENTSSDPAGDICSLLRLEK